MKRTWNTKIRPIEIDGPIARVTLSDGSIAIIDSGDAPIVQGWNWSAHRDGGVVYAFGRGKQLGAHILPLPNGMIADHADGDPLNCRRSNLRPATKQQNTQNRRKGSANTSGFKGVSYRRDRGTWLSCIRHEGKLLKIGTFKSAEDAAHAYDSEAARLFGDFAYLNFPKFKSEVP